jgi:hypothetical protein
LLVIVFPVSDIVALNPIQLLYSPRSDRMKITLTYSLYSSIYKEFVPFIISTSSIITIEFFKGFLLMNSVIETYSMN